MKSHQALWTVGSIIFVVMLILLLLLTDVQLAAFNEGYYSRQYDKFGIPQAIGIEKQDLMQATHNLLGYIDNKRGDLNFQMPIRGAMQEFFSERDKLHMIDVKNLFVKGKLLRNTAFWYCLLFAVLFFYQARNRQRRFSKLLIYTSIAGIIPIILLAVLMSIDFYKYFTIFHELFFNNDLWQLDPATDRLINMFPEAFFSETAFRIVFYYIGELIVLLLLGVGGLFFGKRSNYSK